VELSFNVPKEPGKEGNHRRTWYALELCPWMNALHFPVDSHFAPVDDLVARSPINAFSAHCSHRQVLFEVAERSLLGALAESTLTRANFSITWSTQRPHKGRSGSEGGYYHQFGSGEH
jgi:hypothetical protein